MTGARNINLGQLKAELEAKMAAAEKAANGGK